MQNNNHMNILLLGSGGREHAIAWKLKQSYRLDKLFIAPGNAGTSSVGTNLPISATDFPALKEAVKEHILKIVILGNDAADKAYKSVLSCHRETADIDKADPVRKLIHVL